MGHGTCLGTQILWYSGRVLQIFYVVPVLFSNQFEFLLDSLGK